VSVRAVVCCNGTWPGRPCRATFPAKAADAKGAREESKRNGWSQVRNVDYCPACTRRRANAKEELS
jgi:hypothetical protein